MLKLSIKNMVLSAIILLCISSIGAYLPTYSWGESYKVDLKVELQEMKNMSEDSRITNDELILQYNKISKIAEEHCSNEEIEEMHGLFLNFLNNKNEETFNIYSERTTEMIVGKTNFILFFIIIIIVIAGTCISLIKRKFKNKRTMKNITN